MILLQAAPVSLNVDSVEQAASTLYQVMIPEFSAFIGIGQAIGLVGSLFYVFYRVWAHTARNEPIDVFPLIRPLTIALALLLYPVFFNGIVQVGHAVGTSTEEMGAIRRGEVAQQLADNQRAKNAILLRNMASSETALPSDSPGEGGFWSNIFGFVLSGTNAKSMYDSFKFGLDTMIELALTSLFALLFIAVSIGIKVISTYFLIILGIFGPLTIGLGLFEWFYGAIAAWVARVLHLLLWIPIANIFGFILDTFHLTGLKMDYAELTTGQHAPANNLSLLLFYMLGIVGYMLVPKLATWIMDSTGVSEGLAAMAAPIRNSVNNVTSVGAAAAGSMTGKAAGAVSY